MYIYNITFVIEKSIEKEWLKYIRQVFIPKIISSKIITSYLLSRVINNEIPESSFSIQFETDSKQSLDIFLKNEMPEIISKIHQKFSPRMLYFATELEVISKSKPNE